MERAKWPALSGFLLGTIVLARAIPTSFAFDRPVHSSVAILAGSGAAIVALTKWLPKEATRGTTLQKSDRHDTLPLIAVGHAHSSRESSPFPDQHVSYTRSLRKLRICFILLTALLCLRVEVLRQVVDNVQCARQSWTWFLPIAFAFLDYWTVQRIRRKTAGDTSSPNSWVRRVFHSPYAYLIAASMLSLGAMLSTNALSSVKSTYICAAASRYRWTVPNAQTLGTLLDCGIIYCVSQLLVAQEARGPRTVAIRLLSVGSAILITAGFWLVVGVICYIVQETGRRWLLTIPRFYFWSVIKLDVHIAFTLICALITVLNFGVLTTVLLATFTTFLTITTAASWSALYPFSHGSVSLALFGITLALAGISAYLRAQIADDRTVHTVFHRRHAWIHTGLIVMFTFWAGIWVLSSNTASAHPIDGLISRAQSQHSKLQKQMWTSRTLGSAVKMYQNRYGRPPPPNFDKWYTYATMHKSHINDGFDGIHRDLLPFYALSPEEIRHRTWSIISNPWNDAAGVLIRNGTVTVAPNVMSTHKWMLEGIVEMISKFAESLPDMDLAFNLNDECRVSVPYEIIEPMRRTGNKTRSLLAPQQKFSNFTADKWEPVPEEPNSWSPFREISWQQTFHRVGNKGCPPNSHARRDRIWDTGTFCHTCARPHSQGPFLANWTLAGDICHQPDLADQHGLYLSPAAFKSTSELYPVFSQSKAHGFNDILYPSAWNYIEKAKYNPSDEHPDRPFLEKDSTLFWRGTTSEGFSHGGYVGQWRGMNRQRFIHIANDVNGTNPPMPLLLPSSNDGSRLAYKQVPVSKLVELLPTDAHFVDSILRCGGSDCGQQAQEFAPLVPPADFQDHWKYKYLLDLDGAGFSGRFLPFLQSRSLPFKAALFREWWDDRITPWVHFVPLDLRGQGLWATFAYFHGVKGNLFGRNIEIQAHEKEAEEIATAGREWAAQVLRKEDMEIYFFRLLLEWGRLVDDRRDSLGFAVVDT